MMNAKRVGEWLVLGVLALGQLACTSMRPVGSSAGVSPAETIEVGDRVSIVDTNGAATELVVTAVGTDFIEGTVGGDTLTRVASADLKAMRVRRNAPGKTAGLVAGLSLLLFVGGLSGAGTMGAMQ
jgi:hypothetical protein